MIFWFHTEQQQHSDWLDIDKLMEWRVTYVVHKVCGYYCMLTLEMGTGVFFDPGGMKRIIIF